MSLRGSLRAGWMPGAVLAALTAMMLAAAPAAANPYDPHDPALRRQAYLGPVWTVADGPACGGSVQVSLFTQPYLYPDDVPVSNLGNVQLQLSGRFLGISGTLRYCTVPVTVAWHNRATGKSGSVVRVASGPFLDFVGGPWIAHTEVHTGSGPVDFSLRPHRPNLGTATARLRVF
ncbi:hypothetical protein [Gordonia sp. VNK21]|uniref:hypothetical protein n=1 Tax=Gordonia sp. VNK21 TaxID=3382483 RepID=UPI0038D43DC3